MRTGTLWYALVMNTSHAPIEQPPREGDPIPVLILGKPDKVSHGEVRMRTWAPRDRAIRAAKTLAIWLGITFLSVAIPLLHFVLVPLFFLIGVILAAVAYSQRSAVLGGKGTCPFCGADLEIVKNRDRWPLDDVCSNCSRHVTIEKA